MVLGCKSQWTRQSAGQKRKKEIDTSSPVVAWAWTVQLDMVGVVGSVLKAREEELTPGHTSQRYSRIVGRRDTNWVTGSCNGSTGPTSLRQAHAHSRSVQVKGERCGCEFKLVPNAKLRHLGANVVLKTRGYFWLPPPRTLFSWPFSKSQVASRNEGATRLATLSAHFWDGRGVDAGHACKRSSSAVLFALLALLCSAQPLGRYALR